MGDNKAVTADRAQADFPRVLPFSCWILLFLPQQPGGTLGAGQETTADRVNCLGASQQGGEKQATAQTGIPDTAPQCSCMGDQHCACRQGAQESVSLGKCGEPAGGQLCPAGTLSGQEEVINPGMTLWAHKE